MAWDAIPMGSARWKKLGSGDWAVENVGVKARVGDVLAVTRKAGGIDKVVVRSVIWEGPGKQWLKASRATGPEGGRRYNGRGRPNSP